MRNVVRKPHNASTRTDSAGGLVSGLCESSKIFRKLCPKCDVAGLFAVDGVPGCLLFLFGPASIESNLASQKEKKKGMNRPGEKAERP